LTSDVEPKFVGRGGELGRGSERWPEGRGLLFNSREVEKRGKVKATGLERAEEKCSERLYVQLTTNRPVPSSDK